MEYTPELINFICLLQNRCNLNGNRRFRYYKDKDKIRALHEKFLPDSICRFNHKKNYAGQKIFNNNFHATKLIKELLDNGWGFNKNRTIDKTILNDQELLEVYFVTLYNVKGRMFFSGDFYNSSVWIYKNKQPDLYNILCSLGFNLISIHETKNDFVIKRKENLSKFYGIFRRNFDFLYEDKRRDLDAIEYMFHNDMDVENTNNYIGL